MKLRKAHNRSRRAGFTLMEMMVVVAIIVALAGTSIYYMAGQIDEGNKTRAQGNIAQLTSAVTSYKAQHAGSWPASLQDLLQKDDQGHGPYIANQENMLDPWGQPYQYDMSGAHQNGLQPDIWTTHPQFGTFGNWARTWRK